MPRRNTIPSYRLHKQSGQAIVTLTDGLGGRRDVLLGEYGTPASRKEYARVIAEWEANGRRLPAKGETVEGLSINELILAYWPTVETYYRHPDGTPTSEVDNIRLALRPLKQLYEHTPAVSFDTLALEALRQQMIALGHCRNRINKDIARIKRLFKWAGAQKLVPAEVYLRLQTVEGLRAGRSEAKETAPVKPVPEEWVRSTLPFLRPHVAAMVELQWLTGMRPGEVTIMRTIDLDMTDKVWLYRPGSDQGAHGQHKTAHRGQSRIILIGPKAQEVLRPWLRLGLTEYLFQPCEAREQFDAQRRANRKSKVPPSQAKRKRKAKSKRRPGNRYRVSSYDHAVMVACDAAFPPPEPLAQREDETKKQWRERIGPEGWQEVKRWRQEHRWHPHQLRHAKATEIRREAGLDAARAVLGHRTPAITEVYAEIDTAKAAAVMEKLG
jgi:integrase